MTEMTPPGTQGAMEQENRVPHAEIFEKQADGTWKTKIHMYNRPN